MQLLAPLVPDPSAPLAAANPLAKLAAALCVMAALFISLDAVTSSVTLVGLLACVAVSGLSPVRLLRRSWPVFAIAVAVAVANILFASQSGQVVLRLGPLALGAETVMSGIALGLRLLAIVLAGVLAAVTTQPVDLADALVQQLGVSPRFALGSLAAMRLLPVLLEERQTIALARRARGLEAGRSPLAAVRLAAGELFALLVAAVRRATRLAAAMQARGLGARPCRTVARPQRMTAGDWAWILGAALLAIAAVAISVRLGTWRPLLA